MITEQRILFSKHFGEGPSTILLKPETRKEAKERGRERRKRKE